MKAPGASRRARTIGWRAPVAALAAAVAASCVTAPPAVHPAEPARVSRARAREGESLVRRFRAAGVRYPARLLVVAFKRERTLELLGFSPRAGRYVPIASFPFTGSSGDLGPKRRSWDHQIPEGFYRISAVNPASLYHLSLEIDYPNASDRALGDSRDPGSEIFIHGDAVSDGCIPIGDRAIEQLFLAVLDSRSAGHEVPVAVFPCRFERPECRAALRRQEARRPALAAFWSNLERGYEILVRSGAPPGVSVDSRGRYAFAAAGAGMQ